MQSVRRGYRHTNPKRQRGICGASSLALRVGMARRASRAGFSLLEVILALTILAGSVAVLGEVSRLALRNAAMARDLAHAQLLCESKMSEVLSGITPASDIDRANFDPNLEPSTADDNWVYSIQTNSQTPGEDNTLSVRVTVTRDVPAGQHPVEFSLVRWMPDPNNPESSSGTSSNGSSSGGTSNGGS